MRFFILVVDMGGNPPMGGDGMIIRYKAILTKEI